MGHSSFSNGFKRRECGAAFLEFAISFPLYMMVILSIIELLYYNFQCVTAQYLVSQAAEDLSKGELRDRQGDLVGGVTGDVLVDLANIKRHIFYLASNSKSDFGYWKKQNIDLQNRAKGSADSQKSFLSDDDADAIINGGRQPPASRYGNISVCAIGGNTANGIVNGILEQNRAITPCGWVQGQACTASQHYCAEAGTSALQNQWVPKKGYPVIISLRYPHKPIAMSFLSGIIGAIPIQADAITRIEP